MKRASESGLEAGKALSDNAGRALMSKWLEINALAESRPSTRPVRHDLI